MIIVQLKGGLGNQMFQYATARRLAYITGAFLKLDTTWFDTVSADIKRKYELSIFNIKEEFASQREIARLKEYTLNGKPNLRTRIFKLLSNHKPTHIVEKYFHFDPEVLNLKDDVYLDGYWQSEKYFHDIRALLIKEFSVKPISDDRNKNMADTIRSSESVSVHVRRGDYVSNQSTNAYHGICSIEYYYKATAIITQKVKDPHFFLFSDDPEWVRENLTFDYPATYVDINSPEKAHEDMRLLSLCKHHVIANSSFSWWGAWLSQSPDKIVVAPKKWFKDSSINTKDLLPANWITL